MRASEELLPAFTTLLRPVQSWGGGVRGGDKLIADVDENREMASGEMINEIGRNALIVLAEMADPANSRVNPELGLKWASNVIESHQSLIQILIRVMGQSFRVEDVPGLVDVDGECEGEGEGDGFFLEGKSASVDAAPAMFAFPSPDPTDDDAVIASPVAAADDDATDLSPDCAQIAAAAMLGIVSYDPCMDDLLATLDKTDSTGTMISRVAALLADALPKKEEEKEANTETPSRSVADIADAVSTLSLTEIARREKKKREEEKLKKLREEGKLGPAAWKPPGFSRVFRAPNAAAGRSSRTPRGSSATCSRAYDRA